MKQRKNDPSVVNKSKIFQHKENSSMSSLSSVETLTSRPHTEMFNPPRAHNPKHSGGVAKTEQSNLGSHKVRTPFRYSPLSSASSSLPKFQSLKGRKVSNFFFKNSPLLDQEEYNYNRCHQQDLVAKGMKEKRIFLERPSSVSVQEFYLKSATKLIKQRQINGTVQLELYTRKNLFGPLSLPLLREGNNGKHNNKNKGIITPGYMPNNSSNMVAKKEPAKFSPSVMRALGWNLDSSFDLRVSKMSLCTQARDEDEAMGCESLLHRAQTCPLSSQGSKSGRKNTKVVTFEDDSINTTDGMNINSTLSNQSSSPSSVVLDKSAKEPEDETRLTFPAVSIEITHDNNLDTMPHALDYKSESLKDDLGSGDDNEKVPDSLNDSGEISLEGLNKENINKVMSLDTTDEDFMKIKVDQNECIVNSVETKADTCETDGTTEIGDGHSTINYSLESADDELYSTMI